MLSSKKFFLVVFVLSAVLLCVHWQIFHAPMRDKCLSLQKHTALIDAETAELERYFARHPDPAAYHREAKAAANLVEELLPDEMTESVFLRYLNEQAAKHHIQIISLSPEEIPREENGLLILPVRLTMKLDYFSLVKLLSDLESAPRYVDIRNLALKSDGNELQCGMVLLIYAHKFAE